MNAVATPDTNDQTTAERALARGFGVLGCNEDGTAYAYVELEAGKPRVIGRGQWSQTGVLIASTDFVLQVKPSSQPASGKVGPKLRGELTFTKTGESFKVVAWLNADGSYGVNEAQPLEGGKRVSPF